MSCCMSGKIVNVSPQGDVYTTSCTATGCPHARSRIVSKAGIPKAFTACSLDSFTPANTALRVAQEAARHFIGAVVGSESPWLVYSGPPGVGKTHLGCAIIEHLIDCGIEARYASLDELFSAGRREVSGVESGFSERLARISKAEMLVLDELGAGRGTDWEIGVAQDLINSRYSASLSTVFITNYRVGSGGASSLEKSGKLGPHTVSRLRTARVVEIDSADWRSQ